MFLFVYFSGGRGFGLIVVSVVVPLMLAFISLMIFVVEHDPEKNQSLHPKVFYRMIILTIRLFHQAHHLLCKRIQRIGYRSNEP
jgi:NhaP-type Na+/H+ or K+/H+ antiporter